MCVGFVKKFCFYIFGVVFSIFVFFGVFDFGGKFILLWLLFVCGWVLDIGFYVKYDGGVFVFGFFEGIVGECGDFLGKL